MRYYILVMKTACDIPAESYINIPQSSGMRGSSAAFTMARLLFAGMRGGADELERVEFRSNMQ